MNAAGTSVTISAYGNRTERTNLFNQTDVVIGRTTGTVAHTLLFGAEVGRQASDNYRHTGYFNNTTTSVTVGVDEPTIATPVTFRQSASDADNRGVSTVAALYVQDQVTLSSHWQLLGGVRVDRFNLEFTNRRNGEALARKDVMVSPRAGLVFKPIEPVSIYSSFSVSHLPSSGDQFSSLTVTTQALEPERFSNYEAGAKWDVRDGFGISAALYRLDRTNTTARDPNDATRTVQTGRQRTQGAEIGVTGAVTDVWSLAGGYVSQNAKITSNTAAASSGATVPLVPHHTLSLWNKVQAHRVLSLGLGVVHQAGMYAAIDNAVTLPSFTRLDGALYITLPHAVRLQANIENLFDTRYYPTSHGNNNIAPGAPRTLRVSVTTGF